LAQAISRIKAARRQQRIQQRARAVHRFFLQRLNIAGELNSILRRNLCFNARHHAA
jgi:hypothetical protein